MPIKCTQKNLKTYCGLFSHITRLNLVLSFLESSISICNKNLGKALIQ